MKAPLFDHSRLSNLNGQLQQVAQDIIRQHQGISFKQCLALALRDIPELDSIGQEPPPVREARIALQEMLDEWPAIRQLFAEGRVTVQSPGLLEGFRLQVWGAGSCGLNLSYLFACHGAQVELNEKRGQAGLLAACSRTPNVSWKNFKQTIQPFLFPQDFQRLYQSIFDHGGVIDPGSKKLRGSIGAFQEACHRELRELRKLRKLPTAANVQVNLGQTATPTSIHDNQKDFHLQAISTGVHATEQIPQHGLDVLSFPHGHGHIFITTTMYPTHLEEGFYRDEWEEGQEVPPYGLVSWRRKNINVQSRTVFAREIERFIFNLQKKGRPEKEIQQARSLHNSPRVAHVFYFGNQRDSYHHGVGAEGYPCLTEKVAIDSWMLNQFMVQKTGHPPLIFLGDATGCTHPLAAIGAYLSTKNAVDLFKYCTLIHNLPTDSQHITQQACTWLESSMAYDRLMVFLQARLCAHYSDSDRLK